MDHSAFKDVAKKVYTSLKKNWVGDCRTQDFWHLGNTFDTMVDYLLAADSKGDRIVATALGRFDKLKNEGAYWWDDFGWWGIAFAKVYKNADQGGWNGSRIPEKALQRAIYCWQQLHDCAPKVWENADQKKYADRKPYFEGGCWNTPFDSCGEPGYWNAFCGIQNTVTNALFMVLSLRLYQLARDREDETDTGLQRDTYLEVARQQYAWFRQWFSFKVPLLNRSLDTEGKALVEERVSTFADNSRDPHYVEGAVWTGDQGLIIGALVDLLRFQKDLERVNSDEAFEFDQAFASRLAQEIVDAVKVVLVGDKDLLQPWRSPNNEPFSNDERDYKTGPGVFMRYLLYASQVYPSLQEHIKKSGYKEIIEKNADCAWKGFNQSKSVDLIKLGNWLAMFNAAIALLPSL